MYIYSRPAGPQYFLANRLFPLAELKKLCYNVGAVCALLMFQSKAPRPLDGVPLAQTCKERNDQFMDEIQSCLDVLRENDVDVDTAVDRLMGNDNLYLEFIKRLPEELNLATLRDALAQEDAESFHFPLHNLKGFAVNLGITEIAEAAQAGLTEFRISQFRNITKLEGLLQEIEASGEKFASALVEIKEIENANNDA